MRRAVRNVNESSPLARRRHRSDGGQAKQRILIQTTFPAPYRAELFDVLSSDLSIQVVYERATDHAHKRAQGWYVPVTQGSSLIAVGPKGRRAYRQLLKSLRTFEAVVVYEYSSPQAMRLMLRCQRKGVPYMINADGALPRAGFVKSVVKRYFITRAAGYLAGSEAAVDYFRRYGAPRGRIFRHPFTNLTDADIRSNPLPEEEKQQLRDQLGLPQDTVVVIAVGQFIKRKGFDVLLDAWREMPGGALLVILGGGEQEENYRNYISAHGLHDVRIGNFTQREELWKFYAASDVFVLPTREDVWGLVVNEAMACGLPVVTTTRCVAGNELVEDGVNGFLVSAEEPKALHAAIRLLCDSPPLRAAMGAASLAKIADFTIENMAISQTFAIKDVLAR